MADAPEPFTEGGPRTQPGHRPDRVDMVQGPVGTIKDRRLDRDNRTALNLSARALEAAQAGGGGFTYPYLGFSGFMPPWWAPWPPPPNVPWPDTDFPPFNGAWPMWLAVGTPNSPHLVTLLDGMSRDTWGWLFEDDDGAESVAWSPLEPRLAVGHWYAPGFTVVDMTTGEIEGGWESMPGGAAAHTVKWSPNGKMIAAYYGAVEAPALVVYDVDTRSHLPGDAWVDSDAVYGIGWSPPGSDPRLAVAHGDSSDVDPFFLDVIDAATGNAEAGWPNLRADGPVAFSPDGKWLAVSVADEDPPEPRLRVIDVETKTVDSSWNASYPDLEQPQGFAWSPSSDRLAVRAGGAPGLYVIDVASRNVESGWPEYGPVDAVAWTFTGNRLAVSGDRDAPPVFEVLYVAARAVEPGWTDPGLGSTGAVVWAPDPGFLSG